MASAAEGATSPPTNAPTASTSTEAPRTIDKSFTQVSTVNGRKRERGKVGAREGVSLCLRGVFVVLGP